MSENLRRTILIDPQQEEAAAKAEADKAAQTATANPLDAVIPAELEDIDPTYRGKTVAEIIAMHKNASSKIGEQANEIGIWRNLVSEYAEGTRGSQPEAQGTPAAEPLELTSDQLLDNPTESITAVVQRSVAEALAPITQRLDASQATSEAEKLRQDYPEIETLSDNEEFRQWAYASPERARLAESTTKGEVSAARYLLDSWRDRQSILDAVEKQNTQRTEDNTTSSKPSGIAGARQSTVESGGTGAPTAPRLNGADIINMINNDPAKYHSAEFQAELKQAAKEGRLSL